MNCINKVFVGWDYGLVSMFWWTLRKLTSMLIFNVAYVTGNINLNFTLHKQSRANQKLLNSGIWTKSVLRSASRRVSVCVLNSSLSIYFGPSKLFLLSLHYLFITDLGYASKSLFSLLDVIILIFISKEVPNYWI